MFVPDNPTIVQNLPFRGLVLSGSFNSFHQGHIDLALAAQQLMKQRNPGVELPLAFEISVSTISSDLLMKRVQQFISNASDHRFPVLVTNAKLVRDKTAILVCL
jgi:phosphopantetheine adenylyltransferase